MIWAKKLPKLCNQLIKCYSLTTVNEFTFHYIYCSFKRCKQAYLLQNCYYDDMKSCHSFKQSYEILKQIFRHNSGLLQVID